MNILHIINRLFLGGAQKNTLLTCAGQHALGHQVTLLSGPTSDDEGELVSYALSGGYSFIEIDDLVPRFALYKDLKCYLKIKKIITELKPDIIHTHTRKAGILARIAAGHARGQFCSSTHNRNVIDPLSIDVSGKNWPVIIHTYHGLPFHNYQAKHRNLLAIGFERLAARYTDAFICVSDSTIEDALSAGIGSRNKYTKVLSGIVKDNFISPPPQSKLASLRLKYGISLDAILVIAVGRISLMKHHEYIIESAIPIAREFPQAHWMFVGEGNVYSKQKALIDDAGLTERFTLTGAVAPEQVGMYMHAADLLIHTSLQEGLPRVLPEAMLAKKPVIAFDVNGAREVVNDRSGILVRPRDVDGLVKSQRRLLSDHSLRIRMGAAGFEYCNKVFSHKLMVEKIQHIYNQFV